MRSGLLLVVLAAGCATAPVDLTRFHETAHLCVHCNCFMPKGTDPHAVCAVCKCGKLSHQCARR